MPGLSKEDCAIQRGYIELAAQNDKDLKEYKQRLQGMSRDAVQVEIAYNVYRLRRKI